MSKIGKQQIIIPDKVEVTKEPSIGGSFLITVRGAKGSLSKTFLPSVEVNISGKNISLVPQGSDPESRALWGTYASHLKNMIKGVENPFQKKLILEGIGYKAEAAGNNLNLALGFSHPVKISVPEGLTVTAEKNVLTISGIDKEKVGEFSAYLRALKKPEPYKGKGFRYEEEVIRRKQGKKSA
jgi:large subunit ribosomal protein L6